jgi:hemolysin activation/secretion protein
MSCRIPREIGPNTPRLGAAEFARIIAATVFAFGNPSAFAQNPADAVPRTEELKKQLREALPRETAPQLPAQPVPKELGKPSEDVRIDVTSFHVTGLSEVSAEPIEKLLQQFVGQQRSYEDLSNAAAAVTEYIQRELGYYLGYAYLPEQTPHDGVIEIRVLEGRLDEVVLNWQENSIVRRSVIENHLSQLQPGSILRVRDVERMVFLLNDLLGLTARVEVRAGRTPGTASLVVTPVAEPRFTGQVGFDNFGSRYSGEYRGSAGVLVNSPLGLGDGLSINGMASTTGGTLFALLNYTVPIGGSGLKAGLSISQLNYKLDEEAFPIGLEGDTTAYSGFVLYPFIRSRNLNLFGQATYDYKQYTDKQTSLGLQNDKTVYDYQVGLVGDFRDSLLGGGISTFSAVGEQGHVSLDNPALGLDNAPNFTKFLLGFSRLQGIVPNRLLMLMRYQGQIALDNLDTTERIGIGGPNAVRAYAPGEASADSAHVLTAELRAPLPERWGTWAREMMVSTFFDWGFATFRHDTSRQPSNFNNSQYLAGGGLGLVWERPHSFTARASLAWRTTEPGVSDPGDRLPRLYASINKSF